MNLFEAFYSLLGPALGFMGGLLWRKGQEHWRFIGARGPYMAVLVHIEWLTPASGTSAS